MLHAICKKETATLLRQLRFTGSSGLAPRGLDFNQPVDRVRCDPFISAQPMIISNRISLSEA